MDASMHLVAGALLPRGNSPVPCTCVSAGHRQSLEHVELFSWGRLHLQGCVPLTLVQLPCCACRSASAGAADVRGSLRCGASQAASSPCTSTCFSSSGAQVGGSYSTCSTVTLPIWPAVLAVFVAHFVHRASVLSNSTNMGVTRDAQRCPDGVVGLYWTCMVPRPATCTGWWCCVVTCKRMCLVLLICLGSGPHACATHPSIQQACSFPKHSLYHSRGGMTCITDNVISCPGQAHKRQA